MKWNRSISLTAINDELEILKFHFGESVFAPSAVQSINGRLADVGAGAGFPGLPLRIFGDDIDLTLIEANTKKCAFLSEVVREIDLERVQVLRARFESQASEFQESFDVVVARALGGYEDLLAWSRNTLKMSGKVVLWVGEGDAQALTSTSGWKWEPSVAIPGSMRRCLVSGFPLRNSGV